MRDKIKELFPELQEIRNQDLREKVISVWEESITRGGWQPQELTEIPFTLLAGKIDMRFIEHVRSCAQMCLAVEKVLKGVWGDRVPIDRDTLLAGALLADVGKPLEYAKKDGKIVKGHAGDMLRHPFSGVGLCYKHGLPDEVMHIVATHSKEGDHVQRTIESIIFHHTDFIDFDIAKAVGK
ncbi:MAG TPA: HDIG domain-containing protein [Phycisphaerae bacterium]|nr:HDIG domain-containing protein [Phycisphaerae bacterium]